MEPRGDNRVDLQPTKTMLWPNSLSITGQKHEKLTSICFFTITNCQIARSRSSRQHHVNYEFMNLSAYLTRNVTPYHISAQACLWVCVWWAYGERISVALAEGVVSARVQIARSRLCVQDMTRAHANMKCKEKNGTFHVYYPLVIVFAPMYSHVTCNKFIRI